MTNSHGRAFMILLIALLACDDVGQGSSEQVEGGGASPSRSQEPATQPPVPFVIIDSQILPPSKRSLTVRLERKVSADTLRLLAQHLHTDSPRYDRTFIEYLLPGMRLGAGAWATAHYDPDLDVRILGSSAEQDELMAAKAHASTVPGIRLGEWIDGRRFGNGRIVLYRDGDSVHMHPLTQMGVKVRERSG